MKKIAFLLQTNYTLHLTTPVAFYAQSRGYDVVDCTSNEHFDIMARTDWSAYDLVVPYGSVQLVQRFKETPLACHMLYKDKAFETDNWMRLYGELALNHDGIVMLAGEVSGHITRCGSVHVRPNKEAKAFIAALFTAESWAKHAEERKVRDDLVVFVSPPKVLEREYRCWVVDGQVIDISQYLVNGVFEKCLCEEPEVWKAAEHLASIYQPANAFVMDIVKTPDGYKLIEFNGFHGAGWYDGRVPKILDAYVEHLIEQGFSHG